MSAVDHVELQLAAGADEVVLTAGEAYELLEQVDGIPPETRRALLASHAPRAGTTLEADRVVSPRQDDRTPPLGWRVVPQQDIPDLAAALKATITAAREQRERDWQHTRKAQP